MALIYIVSVTVPYPAQYWDKNPALWEAQESMNGHSQSDQLPLLLPALEGAAAGNTPVLASGFLEVWNLLSEASALTKKGPLLRRGGHFIIFICWEVEWGGREVKGVQAFALNLIPGSYLLVEEEPTPQGSSVF